LTYFDSHHPMVLSKPFIVVILLAKFIRHNSIHSYQMQMIKKKKNTIDTWEAGTILQIWICNYLTQINQLLWFCGQAVSLESGGPMNNSVSTSMICRSCKMCGVLVAERSGGCIPHCKNKSSNKIITNKINKYICLWIIVWRNDLRTDSKHGHEHHKIWTGPTAW
jgi:hypothetical protein